MLVTFPYTDIKAQIKPIGIDVGIGGKTSLRDLNQNKDASKFMCTDGLTLSLSVYLGFESNWGIWGCFAFDIYNDSRNNEKKYASRLTYFDPNKYYINGYSFGKSNSGPFETFEIATGIHYMFNFKKWTYMPFLGIGIGSTYVGDLYYIVKEKDSNHKYIIKYNYGGNNDYYDTGFAELGFNLKK